MSAYGERWSGMKKLGSGRIGVVQGEAVLFSEVESGGTIWTVEWEAHLPSRGLRYLVSPVRYLAHCRCGTSTAARTRVRCGYRRGRSRRRLEFVLSGRDGPMSSEVLKCFQCATVRNHLLWNRRNNLIPPQRIGTEQTWARSTGGCWITIQLE